MRITRQLALDIVEIDLVPAFGHFAINVSAARMDVEADLPPRCGYTHDLRHVGSADIQIRFDDVVSLKAHSYDKKMCLSGMAALTCRRNILNPSGPRG